MWNTFRPSQIFKKPKNVSSSDLYNSTPVYHIRTEFSGHYGNRDLDSRPYLIKSLVSIFPFYLQEC